MNVGERIKNRRKELGMTVDDLAKKVGKSRATIYRYENGSIEKLPTDVLVPFAEALDLDPDYLMGWSEKRRKNYVLKLQSKPFLDALNKLTEEQIGNFLSNPEYDAFDMLEKFDRLTPEDQKETVAFIDFKLSKYEKGDD